MTVLIPSAAPADSGGEPLEMLYEPRQPVDLRATLGPLRRGVGDPCLRSDDGGIWMAVRIETAGGEAVASLHLTGIRGAVRVRAWGRGAAAALDTVPSLLGSGDDWSDLDTSRSALLADSARRNPGLRLCRTGRVLDALAPAVIEQKITSVEAFRAWRILVTRYGDRPPGPVPSALRVAPTAAQWRRIPSWEWHRAGVDPRRSRTVLQAAEVARGLERTATRDPGEELWCLLRTVNGVGVWTAAETAQRSHGDPDAVSFGDYHLASTVGLALTGQKLDDDGLAELLEPWAGQRQRVVRLVLASGFRAERHGPKMTIQDHRGH
ncbi:DNA-3-methyladenine glycosylase 2 family protein [Herbiconiux sp.]|uniref:DNA-3-methyladenine glycosylase family protein n=1 Tax=Herbiconiux sp. TaxID=1871186 RepID=UPI0025C1D9A5|nr:DNA-3-methyladenine glycosylase 2 family protein [Herbiconiux sp.]